MAWLACDKDGTEKISNSPLVRIKDITKNRSILSIYSKNKRNKWVDTWGLDEKYPYSFEGILLPSGSIQKLIGKTITWKDEPVELNI